MRKKWIWLAPAAIAAMAGLIALGGLIVRLLWNGLLPPLFGWPQVTFWQALGLLVLSRILFGGLGTHTARRSGFRRRIGERWEAMTPDERERFREGMRRSCGFGNSTGGTPGNEV